MPVDRFPTTPAAIHNFFAGSAEIAGHDVANGECAVTRDPALVGEARKLVATEYVRRGFIENPVAKLDENGIPRDDPDHERATYYVVMLDGGVAATVRTIHHDPAKGMESLPVLRDEDDRERLRMDRIEELGVENLIEVSALVRDRDSSFKKTDAMKLYKKIFMDAWKNDKDGKSAFIMACNPRLAEDLQFLFGDSMERVGQDLEYTGQNATPILFANREGAVQTIKASKDPKNKNRKLQRDVVNYFLSGSTRGDLHKDIIEALQENGYDELLARIDDGKWDDVEEREQQAMRGIKKAFAVRKIKEVERHYRHEVIAGAGLMGYTALRTLAVAGGP